jgi:hypothetical protein
MARKMQTRKRYAKKSASARRGRTLSRRRTMKRQSSRKQRGGMCFGNGVGANNGDPNFSIYNTRALQLFPYKPAN